MMERESRAEKGLLTQRLVLRERRGERTMHFGKRVRRRRVGRGLNYSLLGTFFLPAKESYTARIGWSIVVAHLNEIFIKWGHFLTFTASLVSMVSGAVADAAEEDGPGAAAGGMGGCREVDGTADTVAAAAPGWWTAADAPEPARRSIRCRLGTGMISAAEDDPAAAAGLEEEAAATAAAAAAGCSGRWMPALWDAAAAAAAAACW